MGHITLQESLRRAQELDSLRGTIERLESELQQSVDRERSVWREKAAEIESLRADLAAVTEQRDKALDALAALEPYLTTEAQMLDSASLNEGRASSYDTASIKARKVLAEARGCEE